MSCTLTKLMIRRSKSSGRAHIEGRLVAVDMVAETERERGGQRMRRTGVLRHMCTACQCPSVNKACPI